MNKSETSIIKEIFLSKLGSNLIFDSINLFLITPMGILGTILMFVSLVIFLHKDFRKLAYFQYLQVYTLSSLIQAATLIFMFYQAPSYLFEISISMSARIYGCKILNSYVIALLFFYNDAIFILLNLERISNFAENSLNNFKKVNPYLACFILLVICELFNLPTFFVYDLATDQDIELALSSYKNVMKFNKICIKNSFGFSSLGQALGIFGYLVKGLITLLIDIGSTLASAYYIREFYRKKKTIQQQQQQQPANTINKKEDSIEKSRVKQMKMIIYLSVCTVIFHIIQLVGDIIILLSKISLQLLIVKIILLLVVGVKQILNFYYFFYYNRKFRQTFKSYFGFN
jgi:hypothetical protein